MRAALQYPHRRKMWLLVRFVAAAWLMYAVAAQCHRAAANPFYNWDLVAYTAIVLDWESATPEEAYAKLPGAIAPYFPEKRTARIFTTNWLSNNSKALNQQFPFYTVKPLYPALLWVLHQAGLDIVPASVYVSAGAIAAIVLVLACWRPAGLDKALWWALLAMLVQTHQLYLDPLGKFSTPDGLATALVLGGCYAGIARRRLGWATFGFTLALAARPDMLLLGVGMLALMAYRAWLEREARGAFPSRVLPYLASMVWLGALYLSIMALSGYYGWQMQFSYTFFERYAYPAEATVRVTFEQYLMILRRYAAELFSLPETLALTAAGLALALFFTPTRRRDRETDIFLLLMLLTGALFVLRVLIYPNPELRYYCVFAYLAFLAEAHLVASFIKSIRLLPFVHWVRRHSLNFRRKF